MCIILRMHLQLSLPLTVDAFLLVTTCVRVCADATVLYMTCSNDSNGRLQGPILLTAPTLQSHGVTTQEHLANKASKKKRKENNGKKHGGKKGKKYGSSRSTSVNTSLRRIDTMDPLHEFPQVGADRGRSLFTGLAFFFPPCLQVGLTWSDSLRSLQPIQSILQGSPKFQAGCGTSVHISLARGI